MNWLQETNWQELLTDELQSVRSACGDEVALSLIKHFSGTRIFVSGKVLRRARAEFIKTHPALSTKSLSIKLGCSEKFVQSTRKKSAE